MRFGRVERMDAFPGGIVCCDLFVEEELCFRGVGSLGENGDGSVIAAGRELMSKLQCVMKEVATRRFQWRESKEILRHG